MLKLSRSSLFVISSPFQAICAIEAVSIYNFKDPVFIILQGKQSVANSKVFKILELFQVHEKKELVYTSYLEILLKSQNDIKKMNLKYNIFDYIFLGNYYSPAQRLFLSNFRKCKNTEYIYLDDGNSSIEAVSWGLYSIAFQSISIFLKINIAELFFLIKGIKIRKYFSVFDLFEKSNFNTIPNNLNFLKKHIAETSASSIYILGSNLSNLKLIKDQSYLEYFRLILNDIKINYSNQKIYYCPHRGESISLTDSIRSEFNVELYDTEYTIEIDFALKKITPLAIYSFGSTASYTLKILFPSIKSFILLPKTTSVILNKSYNEIKKFYLDKGIIQIFK